MFGGYFSGVGLFDSLVPFLLHQSLASFRIAHCFGFFLICFRFCLDCLKFGFVNFVLCLCAFLHIVEGVLKKFFDSHINTPFVFLIGRFDLSDYSIYFACFDFFVKILKFCKSFCSQKLLCE